MRFFEWFLNTVQPCKFRKSDTREKAAKVLQVETKTSKTKTFGVPWQTDNFTRKGKYSTSSYLWWNAKLPRHFSECLYADDTKLVGEGNTLNSEPLVVTKTAECIDACINTWGCNYWTVEKSDNDKPVKCTLKSWKGRQVQEPGFISGSLPSNCCELMNYFAKFWVWVWDFALVFMQSRLVLKLIKISGMTTKNWLILIFCEAAINSINHGYCCCLPKYLISSENFSFFGTLCFIPLLFIQKIHFKKLIKLTI